MNNTHDKYIIYMVYYKVINAMENRKSRGVEGSRAIHGIQ